MANTELQNIRLLIASKTEAEWQSYTVVPMKGEFVISSDKRKVKVGDGVNTWANLSYINLTPEEINTLISNIHVFTNQAVLDATTASFTQELLTKLNGIASGANKTIVDSALSADSTNPVQNKVVNTALSGKVPTTRKINNKALTGDITLGATDVGAIPATQKGQANGVATLGSDGKVPSTQLPSYVDDVLEGYLNNGTFYKTRTGTSPNFKYADQITPEKDKIYVDLTDDKTYRYSGSQYTVISETLALGETASTAFRGDYGKIAYDYSQAAHAPVDAEKNVITSIKRNGTTLTVASDRSVDITVPTKTSDITNDSGFITNTANVASATKLKTARKIEGVDFDGSADITHYGTCSTVAGTAAKVVALTGFKLVTGARVIVKFTVNNTAVNPTLNVNSTGAKAIQYRGSNISAGYLAANRTYEFIYDGTNWQLIGDINTNTTYDSGSGITIGSGNKINHTNSVTAGTAKGSDNKALTFGGTFTIPTVTYDAQGHITAAGTTTMTMPSTPSSVGGSAGSLKESHNFSITGGATAAAVAFNGTQDVALTVTAVDMAKLYVNKTDTVILNGNF